MKKTFYLLILAVITLMACQNKSKIIPVDTAAAKVAVNAVLDNFNNAMKAKNSENLTALFTEDCLYLGTDAKEFWDKSSLLKVTKEMFADESLKVEFKIDKCEVLIATDGKSAVVIQQMYMPLISYKMPVRFVGHLVTTGEKWLFDFASYSIIPHNEDLVKLNKALE